MIGDTTLIHKKNTFKSMTKDELIEACMILESNNKTLDEWCDRLADINSKLVKLLDKKRIEWLVCENGRYHIKELKETE